MKLDGRHTAALWRQRLAIKVQNLSKKEVIPRLVVILVGEDSASEIYVRNKHRQATEIGIQSDTIRLPATISQKKLLQQVDELNHDASVDGILIQLPLPEHLDETELLARILPEKDVDGFHLQNVGRLWSNQSGLVPATPAGIMALLAAYEVPVAGQHAVVVGRSRIVGRPMAAMLLNADATVTLAHSKTKNLADLTQQADILIVAVGQPHLITKDMVKPGAVVIDVGMNRLEGHLTGDVDYESVKEIAGAVTPVPGGVGPMTIAALLAQTVAIAERRLRHGA